MATVKDLLEQTEFEKVWDVLRAADEEAEKYKETYEDLYKLLRDAEPEAASPPMTIKLELAADPWVIVGDDEEAEDDGSGQDEYVQVFGYLPGDEDGYAIGVKPPAQIAAMEVHPDTLAQYDPATILAHCIAEITYSCTTTESLWSPKMDTYAGGLYASTSCAEKDMSGLSIEALRRELGLLEEEEKEDYREKYGFLF